MNLNLAGEDVLIRTPLGQLGPGTHTVTATHDGAAGTYFYFDFLEIAIPSTTLPTETSEMQARGSHGLGHATTPSRWRLNARLG